jgi:membrane-anchored protein YejM (alkaline phosphatase superfamily)
LQGVVSGVWQRESLMSGYYASVAYMDAQVGKMLDALEEAGIADESIVIFTSDHGYHLGEHDFWAKVSLHEESAAVPLIVSVPMKDPAVCDSLVELLDLYPELQRNLVPISWTVRKGCHTFRPWKMPPNPNPDPGGDCC